MRCCIWQRRLLKRRVDLGVLLHSREKRLTECPMKKLRLVASFGDREDQVLRRVSMPSLSFPKTWWIVHVSFESSSSLH
jgi:hypothetical protein